MHLAKRLRLVASVATLPALLLLLVGCGGSGGPAAVRRDITGPQLLAMMDDGRPLQLVDVRTPAEYAAGHIPGTVNLPHTEVDIWADSLIKQQRVVCICRSGVRSKLAADALIAKGFHQVYNLLGGMLEWTGPVETEDAYRINNLANVQLNGAGDSAAVDPGENITGRFDCALYNGGSHAGEVHTVAVGLRNDVGDWVGGEPVVPAQLAAQPGDAGGIAYSNCQFMLSTAGLPAGATCTVWVHDQSTDLDAEAIQGFKAARPMAPGDTDKPLGTVTINQPPAPSYYYIAQIANVHLTTEGCGATAACAGCAQFGPDLSVKQGKSFRGWFDCRLYDSGDYADAVHTVVVGLRDAGGHWIGGTPVIPGQLSAAPGSTGGTLYTHCEFDPLSTVGITPGATYDLWVHDEPTGSPDDAIGAFQALTVQVEGPRDKIIGLVEITPGGG